MTLAKAVLLSYSGEPKYYAHRIPDLGIAYIASILKESGYKCKFFDLNLFEINEEQVLEYIAKNKPGLVGMKLWGNGFLSLIELAKKIKKISPKSVIVAGGPQVTLFKEQIFDIARSIDFLIYGEGELALKEFIEYLNGKRTLRDVRNLIFKENGNIVRNQMRLIRDLDSLPLPDWSVFSLDKYFPLFLINMKRGCQFQCAFCSHNYFWGREIEDEVLMGKDLEYIRSYNVVRKRSWNSIKQEIDRNLFKYNVAMLEIVDSTPDIELLTKFSEYVINKKIPITWASFGRINYYNEDTYKKFSDAGCSALWYGIESGNKQILEKMGKTYGEEEIKRDISLANKYGIKAICAMIIGFPGETEKTLDDSISLMKEINVYTKVTIPFFLQRGSPIAFKPEDYNLRIKDSWIKDALKPWTEKEPHEISYYTVDGIPSRECIQKFEKRAKYKNWVDKRNLSETEILVLLSNYVGMDALSFGKKINNAIDHKNIKGLNSAISEIWGKSKEKINKMKLNSLSRRKQYAR